MTKTNLIAMTAKIVLTAALAIGVASIVLADDASHRGRRDDDASYRGGKR